MANNEIKKRIGLLPVTDEHKQALTALISYFPPKDATALIGFLEEKPNRAEKLCAIMAKKFKAMREEKVAAWDKALAEELALLMQAD
ncbi:hypothetical protein A3B21_00690 [Candidatus Uhrbacteria bacterium RIFCSPLOWO2_01_FULL_47_24]|uniref:Uncharacterized protein n=1 Tax=Candidatus Uhrbacteria bacterium RIFCSPLOWO2_01_FULL_47_24 TaxID=1802401 RepID=A0A1F7UQ79_9BACT|nr:MAG: hypothetical protein A2753_04860 [Candidatus Uhrbacteria bacterium RIFCSPHIGHO2_01_FULL_47_11]OGL67689.1 MAG: hypothetical protein A3D58_04580 [Candidatus Uhrbacteria bacterium RIFCSPHIGHO2_02_FULL_46_47]OGL74872.1 MAG: hypothetical protein A3F52_00345 [Candidatus Uhrbacteria bacterium RIFCSPHIGHO2_12_FULL_47_11]OGL79894.1 MAG: hypothetical protein A3B21_00690 [Candidatus Uhrbacteria bacterium RIFCSPLOWO2_01_FULL_47_24]OGL84114.1 MAG: hypothetical protein A3J03_03485 [Candidatus Uhrbact